MHSVTVNDASSQGIAQRRNIEATEVPSAVPKSRARSMLHELVSCLGQVGIAPFKIRIRIYLSIDGIVQLHIVSVSCWQGNAFNMISNLSFHTLKPDLQILQESQVNTLDTLHVACTRLIQSPSQ